MVNSTVPPYVLPPSTKVDIHQGFDTDDGSSWYDIHDNVLWKASGWKMDYGGHDSAFHDNIVYNDKGGQACINTGGFLPGHGVHWYHLFSVTSPPTVSSIILVIAAARQFLKGLASTIRCLPGLADREMY